MSEATVERSTNTIIIDPVLYTLHGNLVFDNGLPAAGVTVRLYDIGFGGQATKLGEVKSDAQGAYSFSYRPVVTTAPGLQTVNLQVRAVDHTGKEITISKTKFNAGRSETLNLVVPASVQPLAPEFQRLSADLDKSIGGIVKLGQAQEGAERQDLTLLNQSTNWDARLIALAASAAQQTATTGLGQDVLYALFRVGLPTDSLALAAVPSATVKQALTKATQSEIISYNDQQIAAATTAFQQFASKRLLASTSPGAGSTFSSLLAPHFKDNPVQQTAFADLYFSAPVADSSLWTEAAQLGIPAQTINDLRLQGKFLHLTFNNGPLAAKLQQDIGSIDELPKLADKDYHQPNAWQKTLTALAGTGDDKALDALVPPIYSGTTTADRLAAYSGDLARKVRISFPTHTVARMVENQELQIDPNVRGTVTTFLRAASTLGYSLGRTPLNAFLANSAKNLPALDDVSKQSIKTLHRLFQITPSTESLQAALKLGFTSASQIASHSKTDFLTKYGASFPPGEAELVYGQAQTISSVTFNVFSIAKQLDTSPPVYALSSPAQDRQDAKDVLVKQFPSMAGLFGNLDFCQCEACRSVLSPAAYFVDLLDLLGQQSTPNAKGNTPLDVLIGKTDGIPGRRPDLGALPLTCENTNTAMPYIDLVNEILEYFIAHNDRLDAGAAYDTGSATTADLTAEPQHLIPGVYTTTLKQAVYPLTLPFDLWIETVRGFLGYFKTSLPHVLEALRPADTLELFAGAPPTPYYRAQILAESLRISPSEYAVFTATDTANWFTLYGNYTDEATALNDLKNAKTLSQRLGVSYQGLTNLIQAGFLNPGLYALIFQFKRFGIDMGTAFSFTGQPGFPTWVQFTASDPQRAADFQALLSSITARYKQQNPNSTFDATAWLKKLLPADYSKTVLVLADPNTGCDFSKTTLQYADGSPAKPSPAKPLDFLKLNLLVRLATKLGCDLDAGFDAPPGSSGAGGQAPNWTLDELDRALQAFFPTKNLPAWGDGGFTKAFGSSWKTALVYLAHLDDLNTRLAPALGRIALLPLWQDLPTTGKRPLYAQLFLTSNVLNTDFAFDDPNGSFPSPTVDLTADQRLLSSHATAIQGALGLSAAELTAILADAAVTAPASFSLGNLSLCYRYSLLAQGLQISVSDMIALKVMSGLNPFQPLTGNPLSVLADDILLNQTLALVKQVGMVQDSGFTIEDVNYLLRHHFDPVGQYQTDPNSLIALVQAVANGIRQIQAQNAVPADVAKLPETLIDQKLSGLFPAAILKSLFAQLNNSRTYSVSVPVPVSSDTGLSPEDFAEVPEVSLSYEKVSRTQTLNFTGLLLDWKKAELQKLNTSPALNGVMSNLLYAVQEQARTKLDHTIADVLGVWAGLVQYEAVATGVPAAQAITDPDGKLTQADPSLSFTYDESDQLQWLGYRGVLTTAKLSTLTTLNPSTTLAKLLANVQHQSIPAYNRLIGSLLAMWCNGQTYKATQNAVAPANQVTATAFSAALAHARQIGTIAGPVPALQFTYDARTQTQTLTCDGVLLEVLRTPLAGLMPSSAVLAGLLQSVRAEAVAEFQTLAGGLLAATGLLAGGGDTPVPLTDPDTFLQPLVGVAATQGQKFAKTELLQVFAPLLAQKLSRQLVIQTLSANLGADSSLIEALVTDAALLNNPSDPGKSLLQAFLAVGQPGVSASYYNHANVLLAGGIAATVDTADPTNKVAGTAACRFEGFLQAPTDGPYRFFAELGNTGTQVTFSLDSPDPAALFTNPILKAIAIKDGDEASQFVQLKGGVAYRFTVDFQSLGTKGARLLIQGENLPKGPLNQIVLYPQEAANSFARARVLLSKALQILGVTGLDLRELSYFVEHAAQFNNLTLSSLPTQTSDDSIPKAVALFSQFLTLADYADLRKGPAGGTDGLIDVFQAASQAAPTIPPTTVLANLTRRDPQLVQDVASVLWPGLPVNPHVADNIGIRRLWDALRVIAVLGLPVKAVADSTAIVTAAPTTQPNVIAAAFKDAVKAHYTPDQWRPIAKSVFDPLRQKKRDALVSYLVNTLGFSSSNQLFEYFLVDPGMEPIVQTSRLSLALSSVQTFIQRCFLNLENDNATHPELNVSASAIPADWWPWMKRYRVWQANREIFLFPENWMEPELRLDKTDLFQTLESALLQGDVTSDLVEDAFLDYLKGLDLRARLDIVATYLDQDMTNPGDSTLHVLGRTYGLPHKYFYRTYSNGTWSGWQAVPLEIESDHIVLAIWRGRLNLLWLTFISKAQPPSPSPEPNDEKATDLSVDGLESAIVKNKAQKQVQIQLHWSEYVQGKWTNRISTDVVKSASIDVEDNFDPSQVHPHVTKETDSNGNEGALLVHLDFPLESMGYAGGGLEYDGSGGRLMEKVVSSSTTRDVSTTFRITSKNCAPDLSGAYWAPAPACPYNYNDTGVDATFYTSSSNLSVSFQSNIQANGTGTTEPENILDSTQNFEILRCSNPLAPPFSLAADPLPSNAQEYWDAGNLVSPFFYKDTKNQGAAGQQIFQDERTFFVQPSLTETITEWDGWAIGPLKPSPIWTNPNLLKSIPVVAQVPLASVPLNPGDPVHSIYPMHNLTDWVTNPAVTVAYGGVAVAKTGGVRAVVSSGIFKTTGVIDRLPGAALAPMAHANVLTVNNQGITTSQLRAIQRVLPASTTRLIPMEKG